MRKVLAVGGSLVMTVLVGCSEESPAAPSSAASPPRPTTSQQPAANDAVTVIVNGQRRPAYGDVACSTVPSASGDLLEIKVGKGNEGPLVRMIPGDPPDVLIVTLGDSFGDAAFTYQQGLREKGASAQATKAGNTYTISGSAFSRSLLNKSKTKAFEIVVTCP